MAEAEFSQKFIVFFDVLGWKHHIQAANEGRGLTIIELEEIITALGTSEDRSHFEKYGPTICPRAPRIRSDLDFRVTAASDCAIVSAEISPAGLINLVSHCWSACLKLLSKGMMCRGYIKRGPIHHTDKHQFGIGLNEAIEGEKNVSFFREDANDRGTPFIEVDQEIVRYVEEQPDACVKEMSPRSPRPRTSSASSPSRPPAGERPPAHRGKHPPHHAIRDKIAAAGRHRGPDPPAGDGVRIPIGLKIFSIALALSLLMAGVAAYSVLKVHEIAAESDVVARTYLKLIERVSDAEENVLEQEIMLERLRLLARERPLDTAAVEAARAEFDRFSERASANLRDTSGLLEQALRTDSSREAALEAGDLAARLDAVAREHQDFADHALRLIQYSLDGREEAREAFAELIVAEEREFDEEVSRLRARIGHFAEDAANQARDDAVYLEKLSLALTGLAVLVGLLIAAAVTIGLVRPVRRLLDGMHAVQDGNLDVAVDVSSRDEIGLLSAGFNEMTVGLRAKERIKNVFGHYVDPRIVEQLIERPDLTEPGGERREMTIFFSDIAGFTAISEQLTAHALVDLINAYLTEMSKPIQRRQGVVDKFIGDAIMAFWGPPFVPAEEQAELACQAALDSLAALADFQARVPEITGLRTGAPRIDIRIGIATGPALVGNVGSDSQKNYTVMGDTVNVASRLEGACKEYGVRLLISEATRSAAGGAIEAREIDSLAVKGKDEPVRVFEPLAASTRLDVAGSRLRTRYEAGLAAYRARDWDEAQEAFEGALELAPEDGPSAVMLRRIASLREADLPDDWDGVWRLSSK